MMYCEKHCYWHSGAKCDKCLSGEPPYLRIRDEVADPNDWKLFKRRGWIKDE